jgi:leader peptidase (prepilin peptidase)/N-methyltransferase
VTAFLLTVLACFGLLIGSFLNVVVWRVPRGESIVRPPSACPSCHALIRPRDNVPVISWLLLRGRCRACGCAISRRYPIVEASTALVFVLVGLRLGATSALPAFVYLAGVAIALALIDLDTHRLPNAIVLPSYLVIGVLLLLASGGSGDWSAMWRALIGGAAMYAFYFVAMVVYPAGMGFGDVKLAGLLGLCLGWLGWGALVRCVPAWRLLRRGPARRAKGRPADRHRLRAVDAARRSSRHRGGRPALARIPRRHHLVLHLVLRMPEPSSAHRRRPI